MAVASNIPSEKEWREVFRLYQEDGSTSIPVASFPNVIRSLRQIPSKKRIDEMIEELDPKKSGKIDWATFQAYMPKVLKSPPEAHELVEALEVFDQNRTGKISVKQFSHILKNVGEPLTDAELDQLYKDLNVTADGEISTERLLQLVLPVIAHDSNNNEEAPEEESE